MGGSAPAMANQVAEGFILLSTNSLKGFTPGELNLLRTELDKLQREARAVVPPPDDALANQSRNRRIAPSLRGDAGRVPQAHRAQLEECVRVAAGRYSATFLMIPLDRTIRNVSEARRGPTRTDSS